MLLTINDAKQYAIEKVKELTWEEIDETEKEIIETIIEEDITEKIYDIVSEEDITNAQLGSEEELEWFLFNKIPNYSKLLEETVVNFLSEYLSEEEDEDNEPETE